MTDRTDTATTWKQASTPAKSTKGSYSTRAAATTTSKERASRISRQATAENTFENDFDITGIDLENIDFTDDDDDYNDPEYAEQPSDNDKRNSSNTELDFEDTQDVD